ncbi:uncharacterized protein LOC110808207 isoform X2 [Carica papaya]|uniref:uncharacterized protein LOC110808207 isoform X2 n=1 Tax=Carica papaya TaxID=3649 RepID=UPI000B8CD30C|nr:uncharacterized protein LOC110808207 isoform X2 [Carica papaya]
MAALFALQCFSSSFSFPSSSLLHNRSSLLQRWKPGNFWMRNLKSVSSTTVIQWKRRRTLICAVNQDAEEAFKKTVEVDRLIDTLRDANPKELDKLVVENILAFNEGFWIRLAARTDTCKSEDDKKDYEELATSVMSIVDCLVHKTHVPPPLSLSLSLSTDAQTLSLALSTETQDNRIWSFPFFFFIYVAFLTLLHLLQEKIESATDVLKAILKPVVDEVEEIQWPPRDPSAIKLMEKEIIQREKEGQLDEGFLSEVNAQLRQAKEDADKPGLEAMLQKVLQLYASILLSKRSYAKKGNEILKAEQFLETMIKAPEEEWNRLLINGMTVAKGEISLEELSAVIKKRIERTLIRTEGGSYQQRVLTEYLKGIQSRAEEIVQLLEGKPQ